MDFLNETPFATGIARAQLLYRDLMLATVVMKATLEPDAASDRLRPVAEQPPVTEADVDTGLGMLDLDLVPVKAHCDLAVYGHARPSPPGSTVESMRVSIRIGSFQRAVLVTGDRRWIRSRRRLVPSAPIPFVEMPITWERAFGGTGIHGDDLEEPYAANPTGRGFAATEKQAEGSLLPNIEEEDELVRDWTQKPMPAALGAVPRTSSMRGTRGMNIDIEKRQVQLDPLAFNFSHTRMALERFPSGDRIEIDGMGPGGRWSFVMPDIGASAVVRVAESTYALPLVPDTLVIFPDTRRVAAVARRALVYRVVPETTRSIRLVTGSNAQGARASTTIEGQRRETEPLVRLAPVYDEREFPFPFQVLLDSYPLTRIVEMLPLCA